MYVHTRSLSPPMGLINHPHPPPPLCTYIPPPISRTCTPSSCSWGLGVGGQGEAARLINWGSGERSTGFGGEGILRETFVLPKSNQYRRATQWDVNCTLAQSVETTDKDWGEFGSSWIMCGKCSEFKATRWCSIRFSCSQWWIIWACLCKNSFYFILVTSCLTSRHFFY